MNSKLQSLVHYGLAVGTIALSLLLYLALTAWLGPGLPTYITFYPSVMVAALIGGIGPGLLATVLAGLAVDYWILEPGHLFTISNLRDAVGIGLFSCMGGFISTIAHLYKLARYKAAAYDQELALREIRREKEFLANLLEHAAQPFATGYPDGRVGRINRAYEQLTGYSAAELQSLDWITALTPPEWRELERQKLEEIHHSGQPARYEKEYVRKDGTRVPIELLVHLVKDAGGKPEYYYSFLTDITERRRAEEKLRTSEDRFKAIAANTPDHILVQDLDLRYVLVVNPQMGLTEREMIGKTDHDFLAKADADSLTQIKRQVLATGQRVHIEAPLISPKGEREFFDGSYVPKFDARGQIDGLIGYFTNVTERKRMEEALRRSSARRDLLAGTTSALLKSDAPQSLVESLCRNVLSFLDCELFFNFLVDDAAGRLQLNACAGISPEEARKIEWLDYGVAVCGCVGRDGCRIVADDIAHTADPRTELVKGYGVQAYACHPLLEEGKVIGTLSFGTRTRARFTDDELSLMKAVADHVAIAMARHRAQAALRRVNEELEQRVADRTAELRASSRYSRSLLEASLDPLVTISPDGKITDVNKATEETTGMPRERLIGSDFSAYFTEPEKADAGYQKVLAEGLVRDYPLTICHATGRAAEVLYNATLYRDEAGRVQGVFAAARDITERRRLEEARVELLRRLAEAEETERGRISRELHDRLGQDLTALKLGLQFFRKQGPFPPAVQENIGKLEQLADGLVRDIHRLAWELRPAVLDDLGLEAALRHYTAEWSENSGVPLDFHSQDLETHRLPMELETTLYRVAQETLTNVIRHAHARRVSVLLERRSDHISLIVEDNGDGFDVDAKIQVSATRGRLGLLGMQERVTLVRGTIEIESAPGAGTTVFVRIPLGPVTAEKIRNHEKTADYSG